MHHFDRIAEAVRDMSFALEPHARTVTGRVVKTEPKLVEPKLNLADYVHREAEPPEQARATDVAAPPAVHRSNFNVPVLRDPLGNDEWGDCGDGMVIHGIECFHADAGTSIPAFSRGDALRLYSEVSGFDPNAGPPGSNPTDVGTDNQQLFDHWRDVGVLCRADGTRHKIAGSLFVDPADERLSKLAIWEFVVLFRAVGLPLTAQGQSAWTLADPSLQGDAAVGSWGYHDIPYISYDSQRYRNDSWGELMLVNRDFDEAYAVQGVVAITEEMLSLRGVSPAGFDWTRLNKDLAMFPPAPQAQG